MSKFVAQGMSYAEEIKDGKKLAPTYVKLACLKFLQDLDNSAKGLLPYFFDEKKAERVCQFISMLPHVKGAKANSNIKLEPWQVFILINVFGWVNQQGNRRYRQVYIEVPRGNGKSTLSAAVALYMLCKDDEQGAEVYSFATTRDQAKIVFNIAQEMVRLASGFKDAFDITQYQHNLSIASTGSKFEALSSEGSTLDGLNTHFACKDELHAHKSRMVYDVVETSTAKREQSLLWIITTAGSDTSGICYEVRSVATKILENKSQDETSFNMIFNSDGLDWKNEEALEIANPNWDVSLDKSVLLAHLEKAKQVASASLSYRTKYLNEWVSSDSSWFDINSWRACADKNLSIHDFAGENCFIGLDLASKKDLTAKANIFKRVIDGVEHFYVFCKYYLPSSAIKMELNSSYQGWAMDGYLTEVKGSGNDYKQVEQDVLNDALDFHVMEVAFDPWQAQQLVSNLIEGGITMVEVRQVTQNFSDPTKLLEVLILENRIHHNGDPITEWCLSNVVCHYDAKDNIYPRKEKPENKIDGAIAMIMALNRATAPAEARASVDKGDWLKNTVVF